MHMHSQAHAQSGTCTCTVRHMLMQSQAQAHAQSGTCTCTVRHIHSQAHAHAQSGTYTCTVRHMHMHSEAHLGHVCCNVAVAFLDAAGNVQGLICRNGLSPLPAPSTPPCGKVYLRSNLSRQQLHVDNCCSNSHCASTTGCRSVLTTLQIKWDLSIVHQTGQMLLTSLGLHVYMG